MIQSLGNLFIELTWTLLISDSNAGFPKYYRNHLLVLNNALLAEGDYPVRCRMYSSNPDLDHLDASSTARHDNQNCLQTSPNVPWEAKLAPGKNQCFPGNRELSQQS